MRVTGVFQQETKFEAKANSVHLFLRSTGVSISTTIVKSLSFPRGTHEGCV